MTAEIRAFVFCHDQGIKISYSVKESYGHGHFMDIVVGTQTGTDLDKKFETDLEGRLKQQGLILLRIEQVEKP